MRILVVAQVEDQRNIINQIKKQTRQPDVVHILVDYKPANTIDTRRKRIAENHDKLRDAAWEYEVDMIWQLEGDVDLPENCLERLIEDYHAMWGKDFGFVSGVQVGRHGLYALGAWHIYEDSFESVDHTKLGIQEVDATGFYCLLAPKHVWMKGKATWDGEPWGPDVNWGLSINKKKYVDMQLHIGHIVKRGIIRPSDASTCSVRYFKNADGEWKYKQL